MTSKREDEWPKEGTVYFHNDGADAVESQPDFDLEDNIDAYMGLEEWMYEIKVEIRLHENGDVEVKGIKQ